MKNLVNEINEAIRASDRSLNCLYEALRSLKSASNWGIFDILGGNFLSSIVKHNKVDNARQLINQARQSLIVLADELDDVEEIVDLEVEASNSLKAFDIIFDNFLSDIMMQNKIKEATLKLERVINQVQRVRTRLIERRDSIE